MLLILNFPRMHYKNYKNYNFGISSFYRIYNFYNLYSEPYFKLISNAHKGHLPLTTPTVPPPPLLTPSTTQNENNKDNKNNSTSCSGINKQLKHLSSSSSNYLPELLPNSPETTIFARGNGPPTWCAAFKTSWKN